VESPGNDPTIRHVVLLGDALGDLLRLQALDPGSLEGKFMPGRRESWKLTILSAGDVFRRAPMFALPEDATHVVISIEGNRAIETSGLLQGAPAGYQESLARLSLAADQFESVVQALIEAALASRLPTLICAMWQPRYPEPVRQRAASAALALFNDRIFRRAIEARISIVDLRRVCSEPGDYADHTLLSKAGLQKAANAVSRGLYEISRRGPSTEVFC
jgi:hypothetical protein